MYSFLQLLQESKWVGLEVELPHDDCLLDARNDPAIPALYLRIESNLAIIGVPKGDFALPQHNLTFQEEFSGLTMTEGISLR
jgi:hypothetical protein